jgi:hypothetical protein
MKLMNIVSKSVVLEAATNLGKEITSVSYKFVRICSQNHTKLFLLMDICGVCSEAVSMFLRDVIGHDCSVTEIHFSEQDERLLLLLENEIEIPPFLEYLLGVQNCLVEIDKLESYDSPINLIDDLGGIDTLGTSLRGGSMATKGTLSEADYGVSANFFVKDVQGRDLVENGSKKLMHEAVHILTRSARIRRFFPNICDFTTSDITKYTRVVMPHYSDYVDLSRLVLDSSISVLHIKQCFTDIFSSLFSDFYEEKRGINPPGDYVERMFFERAERRIGQVLGEFRGFSETLNRLIADGFILNGCRVPSLWDVLHSIKANSPAMMRLSINSVHESHHDLIASNILVNFSKVDMALQDFKLIDCRGEGETGEQYRHWFYDLCKAKFFVSGYDLIRRDFYKLHLERSGDLIDVTFNFDISHEMTRRYLELDAAFFEIISGALGAAGVVLKDPNWQEKILFGEGFMFIADIPPRIVDEADENMVLAFYCFGMHLLMRYLEKYLHQNIFSHVQLVDAAGEESNNRELLHA